MTNDLPAASTGRELPPFSTADLDRIEAAVNEAEGRTAGEIVVHLADRVGPAPEAAWIGATGGAVIGLALATLAMVFLDPWGVGWRLGALLGILVASSVGFGFGATRLGRRWLVAEEDHRRRVEAAARRAFLDHEVFATAERTGILLSVFLEERRARILPDRGIEARVPAETWTGIADELGREMARDPTAAVIAAVEACADLLVGAGLGPDEENQLPDRPRRGGPP